LLVSLVLTASLAASQAAVLTPSVVGDAAVAAAIQDHANLALASGGAVAFSSSDLGPAYGFDRVNDGVIDHSGNTWIPLDTAASQFVAVAFLEPTAIAAVVFHGQTGHNGRSGGTWRLEYTRDASPSGSSAWAEIGTYTYAEAGCATPMPRTLFAFPALANVTGIRLVLQNSACGIQLAVQELEAYGPVSTPPEITEQPTGSTEAEGGDFTFTVAATSAESFQWRKNAVNITGATGSSLVLSDVKTNDAGTYVVVVSNGAGSVTSEPAILELTPAPRYNTYAEAILADSPIHYYPMDETNGTTANDLGTLATTGGTYAGGFRLGQPAVDERLGRAVRFDGNPGTWVDLGLFHPGGSLQRGSVGDAGHGCPSGVERDRGALGWQL
jgi:hypothetical protein